MIRHKKNSITADVQAFLSYQDVGSVVTHVDVTDFLVKQGRWKSDIRGAVTMALNRLADDGTLARRELAPRAQRYEIMK